MKNKSLYTVLAYWFLMLGLVLYLSGCRTKKSSIDSNTKQIENVSIIDKSKNDKTESVQENSHETKTETVTDKSFFESWISFESDKITITDIHGTKTEEDHQSDVKIDMQKQIDSEFHSKEIRETKIVSFYWIGGAVLAICFMFLVNKIFKKSN